jgi:hypothetical protein
VVMTGFLVESSQNLRQHPTDVMISLMQQVASQTHSYTFINGVLNSTTPPFPTSMPAFEPSANAVRVNVLWFASLTLSLASASFGILVKQWLREFLATDSTSPQARLRIRHFRSPALDDWMVWEIAATFPLLLQVSLALFLVGLCFFTADIHNTVGYTTLPLVAGWATLFIAASMAPALSPRCPYKTTLLRLAIKNVHQKLSLLSHCAQKVASWCGGLFSSPLGLPSWSVNDDRKPTWDEDVAAGDSSHDIDVLIAVDSIQTDDQLLTIIWNALQQTHPDPADSVTFILRTVGNRIQSNIKANLSTSFLDLQALPKQTSITTILMMTEILKNEIIRQSPTSTTKVIDWSAQWMKDCVYFILSDIGTPLPSAVNQTFSLLLGSKLRYKPFFEVIYSRVSDKSTLTHVLDRLQGALLMLRGDYLQEALNTLVQHYFCHHTGGHKKLLDVIRAHPEISSECCEKLGEILIDSLMGEMRPVGMHWHNYFITQLHLIHELSPLPGLRDKVIKVVQIMLIQSTKTSVYSRFAVGLHEKDIKLRDISQQLFIDAIVDSNDDGKLYNGGKASAQIFTINHLDRRTILANFQHAVNYQWRLHLEAEDTHWRRAIRMDPLRVCQTILMLLQKLRDHKLDVTEHAAVLGKLWDSLGGGLETVESRHIAGHPQVARQCLEMIDKLDISVPLKSADEGASATSAHEFRHKKSLFPDHLIISLSHFLPPEEDVTFSPRLRQIKLLDETSAEPFMSPNQEEHQE